MSTDQVDLNAFDFVVGRIKDGFVFERFAQDLLCLILGTEFVPVGGIKDRGIDGLDHTFQQKAKPSTIYQLSIERDPRAKILRSANALKKNGITCDRLFYVTNQRIADPDKLIEDLYDGYHLILLPRDLNWLRGNVAKTEATLRVYAEFVRSNAHELRSHSPDLLVTDYVADPRVFVFLRQQFDSQTQDENLRDLLVDSLILYGLEGTDPDKGILRSKAEILEQIGKVVKFPVDQLAPFVARRLEVLATRPRRIKHHHKVDGYCLPYETRLKLDEQSVTDAALYDQFLASAETRLKDFLKIHKVQAANAAHLLSQTFNSIFKRQGLDFANYILTQKDPASMERGLHDIIAGVMDDGGVPAPSRAGIEAALHNSVREIVYRGNESELDICDGFLGLTCCCS
jgi:hypothetical protein